MPADLHDLSRRLVALGYGMYHHGLRILFRYPGDQKIHAIVLCDDTRDTVNDILGGYYDGEPVEVIGPDLSHDGTLGVLLGAMGWPSVRFSDRIDSMKICHLSSPTRPVSAFTSSVREGPTHKHVLAAALVALAESRGGVVP